MSISLFCIIGTLVVSQVQLNAAGYGKDSISTAKKGIIHSKECSGIWMYTNSTGSCRCGVSYHEKVKLVCNKSNFITSLRLEYCYCMTYDIKQQTTVIGYCPYTCILFNGGLDYIQQSLDPEELNSQTCDYWKRTGRLCSDCNEGYGVPVYSYSFKCVECSNSTTERALITADVIAKSLLPLTVMCVIITLFHINILLPPWSILVLASQLFSALPLMQTVYSREDHDGKHKYKLGVGILGAIYGPWNLDFFRGLYTPMCISSHIQNIDAAALDGLLGVYPLFLLALFYCLFKLHDSGCQIVVRVWRPFNACLVRFRRKLNIQSSVIHAFSTFLILSNTKIGGAVFYILVPTHVVYPDGSQAFHPYLNPSLNYFQQRYLIYGTVAIAFGAIFLILPMIILCLYPSHWFQRCLNHLHLGTLTLSMFVDAFQGCYKDGTNGTTDCRYFAVLHFLLRLKMLLLFGLTQDIRIYAFSSTALLFIYFGIFVITQPYKVSMYNRTDVILLIPIMLFNITAIFHNITLPSRTLLLSIQKCVIALCLCCPLAYLCVWVIIKWKVWCYEHYTRTVNRMLYDPLHD